MLKGFSGHENFYDDITPEWNVPGSPLWCDLAMSRTLGLRLSVSGPRSGQCHRSREWYRGLVVALSGSGSENRSLNGVDGLRPCLAPTHSTSEAGRGQGRAGPASEYSESVVVVCCVLPQLRLRTEAPAWLSVTACWPWESHGVTTTEISVTAGPGPGPHSHHSWPSLIVIVTSGCDIGVPQVTGDNAMAD